MAGIMSFAILPSVIMPALKKSPALVERILAVLQYSPPFGAAEAMVQTDGDVREGWGIIPAENRPAFLASLDADQRARLFDENDQLLPEEAAPLESTPVSAI